MPRKESRSFVFLHSASCLDGFTNCVFEGLIFRLSRGNTSSQACTIFACRFLMSCEQLCHHSSAHCIKGVGMWWIMLSLAISLSSARRECSAYTMNIIGDVGSPYTMPVLDRNGLPSLPSSLIATEVSEPIFECRTDGELCL